MFSLVILYSHDREPQLRRSLALWQDVELYASAEKILCVDGTAPWYPDDFQILEIPRRTQHYCWADALNHGVSTATRPFTAYFDADRIVPLNFLLQCQAVLARDDVFVCAQKMLALRQDHTEADLRIFRALPKRAQDCAHVDDRIATPYCLRRKNPFSGGVVFRTDTFQRFGGFDPRFVGWGYPDYDFFMTVYRADPRAFVMLRCTELHQHHAYAAPSRDVMLHNLWNCHQYLTKWDLPREGWEQECAENSIDPRALETCATLDEVLTQLR